MLSNSLSHFLCLTLVDLTVHGMDYCKIDCIGRLLHIGLSFLKFSLILYNSDGN